MKINNVYNYTTPHMTKSSESKNEKRDKGLSLSLAVNGEGDQVTVKIIDNKSNEIIRETTSDELRDMHDRIYDMAGKLFDKKA